MGIIADPVKAYDKSIPCHGYIIDPHWDPDDVEEYIKKHGKIPAKQLLLWKEGVIGALDNMQDLALCDPKLLKIEPTPPKLEKRLQILRGLKKGYPYCFDSEIKESILKALEDYKVEMLQKGDKYTVSTIEDAIEEIRKMPVCEK